VDPVIISLVDSSLVAATADGSLPALDLPSVELERPRDSSHGDWSANIAMKLARPAGMSPRAIAEIVVAHLPSHPAVAGVEIAGPGFINFRLSADSVRDVVGRIREQGAAFGSSDLGGGKRTQVEFVSANPTGPMHVGHGRWAALGDSIARVLTHSGYDVSREFYINDAGVQMDIFAKSVAARYLELTGHTVEFGEDWYRGAYITEIAREIFDADGDRFVDMDPSERESIFKERAYAQVIDHLRATLVDMGTEFDVWFSERTLHESSLGDSGDSATVEAIARLRAAGYVYEKDDAVWFRSTDFDDDKDRVLIKADGAYTYFAADVAYHANKLDRGFEWIIDLWGADHHGYVKRMVGAVAALGHPGALTVVIGQLVTLLRDGEIVRMSKRTGEMVTFEELLDEVGADAARYFFLRRSSDQPVDFDIGLATQHTAENPVFYVQYAHARICSVLRKAAGLTTDADVDADTLVSTLIPSHVDLSLLTDDSELTLMRKLAEFPEMVLIAAERLAPHKLTGYAEELAATFHQFYTVCRIYDSESPALSAARLALTDATRIALALALGLLGVSAPERM
jgi:arginyl-tRNA synthetase